MSKFTSGPWIAMKGAGWFVTRPDAHSRRESALAVGMTPACSLVDSPSPWFEDAEAEANARLMAAAPDMYEALKRIKAILVNELDEPVRQAFWEAVYALAKADGKPTQSPAPDQPASRQEPS